MKLITSVMVMLLVVSASAHEFGDDHGDTAATATSLSIGSNRTGTIEIDTDQDWFSFQATNSTKEYVVAVTTGTLWNSTAGLTAPDGAAGLSATDSVATATARVSWVHLGLPATYFVRVGGFSQFTTGTYSIVVNEQAFVDLDHDGMPDAWEVAHFGGTNEAPTADYDNDGFPDLDEFLAGTNPGTNISRLVVTSIATTSSVGCVAWQAVAYRAYEVEGSTNLTAGVGWTPLGTVTNLNAIGMLQYNDTGSPASPVRFYRVRCLY